MGRGLPTCRPLARSQIRTAPEPSGCDQAVASWVPSGLNATLVNTDPQAQRRQRHEAGTADPAPQREPLSAHLIPWSPAGERYPLLAASAASGSAACSEGGAPTSANPSARQARNTSGSGIAASSVVIPSEAHVRA